MRFRLEASPDELEQKGAALIKALVDRFHDVAPDLAHRLEKALPAPEQTLKYPALQGLADQTREEYSRMLERMVAAIGKVLDRSTKPAAHYIEPGTKPAPPPAPETEPVVDHTKAIADKDEVAYGRVRRLLVKRGYIEADFEQGGPLYGYSVNELIELLRGGRDDGLQKAGPYIGPRGGMWADPGHTQHWEAARPAGLQSAIEKVGGKVRPHESDATKVVLKVPHKHAGALQKIREAHGIEDAIKTGEKYTLLAVPKHLVAVEAPKADEKPAAKPEAKPTKKPPYATIEWKPHATVEDAAAWAKAQGVDVAYSDLATANQINHALSEQHPWVRKHVEFIGTAGQLRGWAKQHPEVNKRAMEDAKHAQNLEKFSLGGSAIAIAHPTTKKPYRQSVVAIADSWGTVELYDQKAKAFKSGFTLGNELRDTVRHELGHVEGFVFRHLHPEPGGPSVWEVWKKHCVAQLKKNPKQVMKDVSEYGATNPHECWAEVSVMRRTGKPLAPWIQAAIDEMKIDAVSWDQMGKVAP